MHNRSTIIKLFISLLFGSAGVFTWFHNIAEHELSPLAQYGLLAIILITITAAAYWGIFGFALSRLSKNGLSSWVQAALFFGMIAAGIFLTLVIPIYPAIRYPQVLEVTATGEKHPEATGRKVSIQSILDIDGIKIKKENYFHFPKKDWTLRPEEVVTNTGYPTTLTWRNPVAEPVIVLFNVSEDSGFVRVQWNGRETHLLDLHDGFSTKKALYLAPSYPRRFIWAYRLAAGSLIGGLLFLAAVFFAVPRQQVSPTIPRLSVRAILAFALPIIVTWLFVWVALWPGLMILDTQVQLDQVATLQFNDAHPVVHTWTMWLITRFWNSPAAISLFQIMALSLAAGTALEQMRKTGVRLVWLVIALVLFTVSIVNALMAVSILKDTFFSIVFLLFFIYWIDIIHSRGSRFNKPFYFAGFIAVCLLTCLYRHSGLPVILFSMPILFVFLKGARRGVAVALLVFMAMLTFIRGPVFNWLNVQRSESFFEFAYEAFHLAAHVDAGTEFSSSDREILDKVRSTDTNWDYTCESIVVVIYAPQFHRDAVYSNSAAIREIFIRSLLRNPEVNLKHMLCSSAIVWRVNKYYMSNVAPLFIIPATKTTKNLALLNWIFKNYSQSTRLNNQWLFWRPAVQLYLFLFGVIVLAIRRGPRFLLASLPLAGLAISYILVNGSQDYRYMYPAYLLFSLYWPYLLIPSKKAQPEAAAQFLSEQVEIQPDKNTITQFTT